MGNLIESIPVPPGTHLGIVSVDSVHNGTTISMATFESTLSLDDTLKFYQSAWPNEPDTEIPGRLVSLVGDWLLISRVRDNVNTVVQLNATDSYRSTGYVSVMPIDSPVSGNFDKQNHRGYREISKTVSKDGPLLSTLSVLQSSQSMSSFIESVVTMRKNSGWRLSSQTVYQGSQIILMSRQSQRAEMVFSRDDQGSVIAVINEVKKRG